MWRAQCAVQHLVGAAATEPETKETEQTDKEGWLCPGYCSGGPGSDSRKKNGVHIVHLPTLSTT